MRVWMPFVGFVDTDDSAATLVTADVAIMTIRDRELCVLLVQRTQQPFRGAWSLPSAPLMTKGDLDATASQVLVQQGLSTDSVALQQIRTYSSPKRDPASRRVSTLYLGVGAELDPHPVQGSDSSTVRWVPLSIAMSSKVRLASDHAQMLQDAIDHLALGMENTSIATAFVAREFTVAELREVYEIVWGEALDPRNFHRKMTGVPELLIETGATTKRGGGRPAALFEAGATTRLNPALVREGS